MIIVMHSQQNKMCAAIISNSVRAKKGKIMEIQIILRLFLVIAIYCQASSSQFNQSLNLPLVLAGWQQFTRNNLYTILTSLTIKAIVQLRQIYRTTPLSKLEIKPFGFAFQHFVDFEWDNKRIVLQNCKTFYLHGSWILKHLRGVQCFS